MSAASQSTKTAAEPRASTPEMFVVEGGMGRLIARTKSQRFAQTA